MSRVECLHATHKSNIPNRYSKIEETISEQPMRKAFEFFRDTSTDENGAIVVTTSNKIRQTEENNRTWNLKISTRKGVTSCVRDFILSVIKTISVNVFIIFFLRNRSFWNF